MNILQLKNHSMIMMPDSKQFHLIRTGNTLKAFLLILGVLLSIANLRAQTTANGLHIPGRFNVNGHDTGILLDVPTGEYNVIRSYNGSQPLGVIHFFDDTWGGGTNQNSAGAINLNSDAITIGEWNNVAAYFDVASKRLGIGTATPTQALDVSGNIRSTDNFRLATRGKGLVSEVDGTSLSFINADWIKMITNRGILFHNRSNVRQFSLLSNENGSFDFQDPDNNWMVEFRHDDYIGFRINNQELLRIEDNGNLGVGTTSPNEKLDVNGRAKASHLISNLITSFEQVEGTGSNSVSGMDLTIRGGMGTGAGDEGNIYFQVGNNLNWGNQRLAGPINAMMVQKHTGNVGIGTTSPSVPLEVAGKIKATDLEITGMVYGSIGIGINPTEALDVNGRAKASHLISDLITSYEPIDGIGSNSENAHDLIIRGGLGKGSGYSGDIIFQVGQSTVLGNQQLVNPIYAMFIQKHTGNVGIGTTKPTKKLSVAGTVNAEELILEDVVGADFVFEEDYDLRTLEATEAFIKANKHLPEIPSAAQMAEEGLAIKQMNILLLQKVEELTLHLIRQEKQLSKQEEQIKNQNIDLKFLLKKNESLAKRIERLETK